MPLKQTQRLDLQAYHPALKAQDLVEFLQQKKRPKAGGYVPLLAKAPALLDEWKVQFDAGEIDSYLCARIIDYIRLTFLNLKVSFTFETVMSHISKVEFLQEAQRKGYRTYLYFISTVDPMINVARVQSGGHGVPEQKIKERYYRSMDLLMQAVEAADRTYIFDNSADGQRASFIAEIDSAEILKINQSLKALPKWFADKVLKYFEA